MKRILSCMQPTNSLHLGNYLGALKNWVSLQEKCDDCLYGIVDLHAITAGYDSAELKSSTREIAAAYMAAGVDPSRSSIFVQSHVPGHSQLSWLFSCITPLGWLNRMTQFKEKAGKKKDMASLGLYGYPVLMAADILIYKATHVPVGDDQKQHLELTREIAGAFNHRFNNEQEFFPLPEPIITGAATRVMSFRDGTKKMSKSAESDMSRINLTDSAEAIAQKIRKAKTDPHPLPDDKEGLEERPEAKNLLSIYAALTDQDLDSVLNEFGGKQFSQFKPILTELAVTKLSPINTKMKDLMNNQDEIDKILEQGAQKANNIASRTVEETMDLMGF